MLKKDSSLSTHTWLRLTEFGMRCIVPLPSQHNIKGLNGNIMWNDAEPPRPPLSHQPATNPPTKLKALLHFAAPGEIPGVCTAPLIPKWLRNTVPLLDHAGGRRPHFNRKLLFQRVSHLCSNTRTQIANFLWPYTHTSWCALFYCYFGWLCTLSHSSTDIQPTDVGLLELQEFAAHHHVTNSVPTDAPSDGWRNDTEQKRHSKNSKATFDTRQNNLLCSHTRGWRSMAACLPSALLATAATCF